MYFEYGGHVAIWEFFIHVRPEHACFADIAVAHDH